MPGEQESIIVFLSLIFLVKKSFISRYTRISSCLYTIPTSTDERGTEWPEEWPKRLDHFPEWLSDSQERIMADTERWRSTLNRSYLSGLGIDWSRVRNVMDMRANYGGYKSIELFSLTKNISRGSNS